LTTVFLLTARRGMSGSPRDCHDKARLKHNPEVFFRLCHFWSRLWSDPHRSAQIHDNPPVMTKRRLFASDPHSLPPSRFGPVYEYYSRTPEVIPVFAPSFVKDVPVKVWLVFTFSGRSSPLSFPLPSLSTLNDRLNGLNRPSALFFLDVFFTIFSKA